MSLSGRGPYLSIKIPRGNVAALKRKDPMVKPRFSISSCSTQLFQSLPCMKVAFVSAVSFPGTGHRRSKSGRPNKDPEKLLQLPKAPRATISSFLARLNTARLKWKRRLLVDDSCSALFLLMKQTSFYSGLTRAKVRIEAFLLQHDEQRGPAQQHSREQQVLYDGCDGHPPPPPVCLWQAGSHDGWRYREDVSVIPCLSCTVSPNTALDFFRSLLKSTSLAKQVINPKSICNRLQVGKLFTWRSLFVLRFFVSVRHNAGTHLLHIHEPKLVEFLQCSLLDLIHAKL